MTLSYDQVLFTESPELVARQRDLENKRERLARAAERLAAAATLT